MTGGAPVPLVSRSLRRSPLRGGAAHGPLHPALFSSAQVSSDCSVTSLLLPPLGRALSTSGEIVFSFLALHVRVCVRSLVTFPLVLGRQLAGAQPLDHRNLSSPCFCGRWQRFALTVLDALKLFCVFRKLAEVWPHSVPFPHSFVILFLKGGWMRHRPHNVFGARDITHAACQGLGVLIFFFLSLSLSLSLPARKDKTQDLTRHGAHTHTHTHTLRKVDFCTLGSSTSA